MTACRAMAASLVCVAALAAPILAQTAPAPRVESVSIETSHPMPVVRVPEDLKPVRALVERSVGRLSEGPLLITAVTLGQRSFRLTPEQVRTLTDALRDAYARIVADPALANVPSALEDAVSADAKRNGHYFLYRPSRVTDDTPVIVFLHGFGGNFQFYTSLLKDEFPDSIIISPSYGIAWRINGLPFLDEVLEDAAHRLGVKLSRPWLFAISAGGPAGFAAYGAAPQRFRGFVCLVSRPDDGQIDALPRDAKVLMLNGTLDNFPIAIVRDIVARQAVGMPSFVAREMESDHFFILTQPAETFRIVREFMDSQR